MFAKAKLFLINTHKNAVPDFIRDNKKKTILFYIAFYLLTLTTFLTIVGQMPYIAERSLTKLFQIGWVLCLIPFVMLDYKRFIKSFTTILILLLPFIIYCLVALPFKIYSITFSGTTVIFLSAYILLIGSFLGKYKTKTGVKVVLFAYLIAAIIYALIVYFTKLRGYDLDNPVYAFGSKNSAGPIFMSAAIISFYLFSKRNVAQIIIRWVLIAFFVVIIAISKNRAVLIVIPFILAPMLFIDIKNNIVSYIIFGVTLTVIILIFAVPQLYETIIINILFNGKRTLDEISSGRLSQIVEYVKQLQPILGNGNNKFDCMPLSFLCTFGAVGLTSLIPYAVFPFYLVFKHRKINLDKRLSSSLIMLAALLLTNSLFEDYGFFGPGAKTFIFWLMAGACLFEIESLKKAPKMQKHLFRVGDFTSKMGKGLFMGIVQLSLFAIPIAVLAIPSSAIDVGSEVVDRLPQSNAFADYVEVKDIQIKSPVESMCVGQRVTFDVDATPNDCYDKLVYWSTAWIENPVISVNGYSGEVTAQKVGNALLHIDRFRITQGVYVRFPVVEYANYDFNKLYISNEKYKKSFDHTEDTIIETSIGCTSNVFFDNYYLPIINDFEFISSDTSVAEVNPKTGVITAKSAGTCEITGRMNNKYNNTSVNKVVVKVNSAPFIPTSFIDIDVSKQCNQYLDYEIVPVFNENASDRNYLIEISNLRHELDGTNVVFKEPGSAHIKIVSQNDPTITKELNLNVVENHPTSFICETSQMKIGEKKTAEELGLYLEYSNGDRTVVSDNDLFFDARDFENRAWSNQNGLIDNRTTVMAIKKGSINLKLTSKIDNKITAEFKISVSAFTENEYKSLSTNIGLVAISALTIVALAFTFLIQYKNNVMTCIITALAILLYSVLLVVLYGFTNIVIICLSVEIIFTVATIVLRIALSKRIPIKVLENPSVYRPKIITPVEAKYYTINI